jgi:hypothetical protein
VQFSVTAASAGQAALTFRYANGTTWTDQVVNASLVAGANTIRATATTANGGPNLDRLRIGPPSSGTGPTAAQLLSKVTSCSQISNGRYKTDSDVATATIPVCQKTGAVFWQGDMDIDCDGVRTTQCNENTDCCFLPETFCSTSSGGPLNAAGLPYVVVPSPSSTWDYRNFNIGCGTVVAVIFNNQVEYAVVGDTGPTAIIGEASYATANDLGINPDPSNGGTDSGVTYIVFQNSQRVSPIESHSAAITLGRQLATSFVANN